MQDKLLFAAGLVALLIGLFVGVRSDNARKAVEANLLNANSRVASMAQQLKGEENRNKVIADKLGGMQGKLNVAHDKLTVANDWYANLEKTNAALGNDIYTIRLALVDVLADLKASPSAAGQASAAKKVEKLVKMLDEHNAAASSGQPSSKAATAAPEQKPTSKEKAKAAQGKVESGAGLTGKAPAASAPEEKKGEATKNGSGQQKKAAPAEKTEKSAGPAPQASAPSEKRQHVAPAPKKEESTQGGVRL